MTPKQSLELYLNSPDHEHIARRQLLALKASSRELGSDLCIQVKKEINKCPLCAARASTFQSRRTGLGFAALVRSGYRDRF